MDVPEPSTLNLLLIVLVFVIGLIIIWRHFELGKRQEMVVACLDGSWTRQSFKILGFHNGGTETKFSEMFSALV